MAMIQGKGRWCKIVGKPVEGYDPGEKNKVWEFEVDIEGDAEAKLAELEVDDKIKERKDDGTKFFKFTKKAYNKDGEANKPIKIVDAAGNDWPEGQLIGNGSTLNVKFSVQDWEFGKKKGKRVSVMAVQVWEHVPYEGGEQFPVREKAAQAGAEDWGDDEAE